MPRLRRSQEAYERFERTMEGPTLLLAIAFAAILVLPAVTDLPGPVLSAFDTSSGIIWAVFAFEYVGLFVLAPDRWRMVRTHIPHLLVIVLPLLRPLRSLPALRLLRLLAVSGRVVDGLRRLHTTKGFGGFLLVVAAIVVLAGVGAFTVERSDPDASIVSAGDGIWWALTTVTTVGYGDRYPVSNEGRALAALLMLVGIALLSVVTANIAAFFVHDDDGGELDEIRAQLDRIEALLAGAPAPAPPDSGADDETGTEPHGETRGTGGP